jgi:hypothetical protein
MFARRLQRLQGAKELDEDDLAFQAKKKAEEKALAELRAKGGPQGKASTPPR